MNSGLVVIDANIAFKALVAGRGDLRDRIGRATEIKLFSPRFLFVELFKHKERLTRVSGLNEDQLLQVLQTLVGRIAFIDEDSIAIGTWTEAHRLCRAVDEKDTPYVALTMHLDGRLWTDDIVLKMGLAGKGFSSFFEP
jgi:predicted nucleic acid-binding protein